MDGHTVVGRAVSLSNTGANTNITGLIIDDNKCWDAAIFLDKAVDLTIKDNDVNLPTSTSSMAISINNVNGGVIKNNTVIGGDRGIRSINSNNIDISYNTVKDTDNVGIYLQTGTGDDISITSNHISNVCVNLGTDCILVDDAITYTADFNTLHGSTNAIYGLRNATAGGNPSSFNNNMFSNLTADIRVNTTNLSWSMQYGSNVLWVDSTGDLRIKAGNPTSDTDGTIVGTQS